MSNALDDLIAKVEAGESQPPFSTSMGGYGANSRLANGAYHGSLDAAYALHNAVISEWIFSVGETIEGFCATVEKPIGVKKASAVSFESTSRAWLVAILKAMKEA